MDPYARDRSSDDYLEDKVINPLKAMTPGLSDDFPVRYDTLGNPQKTYEADTEAGRLFNIFLNPFNTAKDLSLIHIFVLYAENNLLYD